MYLDIIYIVISVCLAFFVFSLTIKVTWNWCVPQVLQSMNASYEPSRDFTAISIWTAFGLAILVSLFIGGVSAYPLSIVLLDNADYMRSNI